MSEFENKVILITGAGRGAGRTLAQAFAAQGAILALNDITPVNLDQTTAGITAAGGQAKSYVADAAKKIPIQTMINRALEDWGRIDILVNATWVEPQASFLELDEWDWRRTLDVNLSGPFFTTQVAGRVMNELGGGVIINLIPARGAHHERAAAVSQTTAAGLLGLTRAAARELTPHQIRVYAICLGASVEDASSETTTPRPGREYLSESVLELPGAPWDLERLAFFLCSAAAAHLSGEAIGCP